MSARRSAPLPSTRSAMPRAAGRRPSYERPSARVPYARRSPRASAAISRIMAMFTSAPLGCGALRWSVGGRERLRLGDLHRHPVAAQLAVARLGDEDGGLALGAGVALAHLVRHLVTPREQPSAARNTTPRRRCPSPR